MTRLEEALKKLQAARAGQAAQPAPAATSLRASGRSAIPIARKKKVTVEGEKHHIEQAELIAAGLLAPLDHAAPVADEFRRIKRPLIVNALEGARDPSSHANVIMIASALPSAGKTFCSVNLAASISLERDLNVVLVDADVAKPHISREFGLADMPGLIDLLVDDKHDVGDVLVRTDLNDIQVLPAGARHPQATELLASDRMSVVVHELATRYPDRLILLDSPPLLATSEAQVLASHVGQIALVVEAGVTTHQQLKQIVDALDPAKAINIILNKSRHWGKNASYGGDYGYYGYEGSWTAEP
jgi:protein-tyrosine kinase